MRASSQAGAQHLVYISVVGADRVPVVSAVDRAMFGYFGSKLAAERTGGYFTQINPDESVTWRTFDLLATLKPEYAQAIRSVDMDGATVGAFAGEAGITPGNAAVRAEGLVKHYESRTGTIEAVRGVDLTVEGG